MPDIILDDYNGFDPEDNSGATPPDLVDVSTLNLLPLESTVPEEGDILVFNGVAYEPTELTLNLNEDIDLTTLGEGFVLRYNTISTKWESVSSDTVVTDDIQFDSIQAPVLGNSLIYNGLKWIPTETTLSTILGVDENTLVDGQLISFDLGTTSWKVSTPGDVLASGLATIEIGDLQNVDESSRFQDNVLAWNSASQKWESKDFNALVDQYSGVSDLTLEDLVETSGVLDGEVITFNTGTGTWTTADPNTLVTIPQDLSEVLGVDPTSVGDNSVIAFNDVSEEWEVIDFFTLANLFASEIDLQELQNVEDASRFDNDVLTWDSTLQKWAPKVLSELLTEIGFTGGSSSPITVDTKADLTSLTATLKGQVVYVEDEEVNYYLTSTDPTILVDWKTATVSAIFETDLPPTTPSTEDVGGLNPGTLASELNNKSISSILEDMLFPTVEPTVTLQSSSLINLNSTIIERGTSFSKVGVSFVYDPGFLTNGDGTLAGDLMGRLTSHVVLDPLGATIESDTTAVNTVPGIDIPALVLTQPNNIYSFDGTYIVKTPPTSYSNNKGIVSTLFSSQQANITLSIESTVNITTWIPSYYGVSSVTNLDVTSSHVSLTALANTSAFTKAMSTSFTSGFTLSADDEYLWVFTTKNSIQSVANGAQNLAIGSFGEDGVFWWKKSFNLVYSNGDITPMYVYRSANLVRSSASYTL